MDEKMRIRGKTSVLCVRQALIRILWELNRLFDLTEKSIKTESLCELLNYTLEYRMSYFGFIRSWIYKVNMIHHTYKGNSIYVEEENRRNFELGIEKNMTQCGQKLIIIFSFIG